MFERPILSFLGVFSRERKRRVGRRKGKLRLTVKFVKRLREHYFPVAA